MTLNKISTVKKSECGVRFLIVRGLNVYLGVEFEAIILRYDKYLYFAVVA